MPITLTKGQEAARAAARSGKNLLISGPGGVGKSYLIDVIVDDLESIGKTVLVTASTGKAATLIGGVTSHRAFRVPISMTWQATPLVREESPLLKADVVLIDEISMIRLDVFEFIVKSIEIANKRRGTQRKPIQIILVGDFAQLPPVIVKPKTGKPSEAALMSEYYGFDIKSGYAFNAPGWARCDITVINLTEVVRQTDKDLIAAANALRMGDRSALTYYKEHARKTKFPKGTPVTYLCSNNKEVNRRNDAALAELPGKSVTYTAMQEGKVEEQDKTVPQHITLKVGAHVLMAVNGDGYHNGSGATVIELREKAVLVRINATGKEILVSYYEWEIEDYAVGKDRKGKTIVWKETVGTYWQIPLRLGYAMTIHRAQGQTLDKVVVDIKNIFCYGQLYVALSRVKSIKDLYIKGDLDRIEILASPEVVEFYSTHPTGALEKEDAPAPEDLASPKQPQDKERSPEKPQKPVVKSEQTAANKPTETIACPKHVATRAWIFASTLDKRTKKGRGTSIIVPAELAGIVKAYINKIS